MKRSQFLTFISIFLSVHLLVNFYIGLRGWQALERFPELRPFFLGIFVLVVFSYLIGEILERKAPSFLSDILVWIGAFWFAFMLYFLLALVVLDLGRIMQYFFHILPSQSPEDYLQIKLDLGIGVVTAITLIIIRGYYNAMHIRVKHLTIDIDKTSDVDSLNIVALSDMHLGTIIGKKRLQVMVDQINALKPDLVLMPGDQVDGNPGPVIHKRLGEYFRKIKAPMGIFAITGNHEYIGDVERSCAYLESSGITMLRDASVEIKGVQIVGREDHSFKQFSGKERKTIDEVMHGIDRSKPIILLDHQPFHLEEAEQAGVDLQLSGHTHHAQLWPLNYLTQKIYEVSWGFKKRGNTNYYVSCGVGTWGPPTRIGSYSEIVQISLKFK